MLSFPLPRLAAFAPMTRSFRIVAKGNVHSNQMPLAGFEPWAVVANAKHVTSLPFRTKAQVLYKVSSRRLIIIREAESPRPGNRFSFLRKQLDRKIQTKSGERNGDPIGHRHFGINQSSRKNGAGQVGQVCQGQKAEGTFLALSR